MEKPERVERNEFLACPLIPKRGSCDRSTTVTRAVTRMRFLDLLTVTARFDSYSQRFWFR